MCNESKQALFWKIFLAEARRLLEIEKDRNRRKELKLAVKELSWLINQKAALPGRLKIRTAGTAGEAIPAQSVTAI